MSAENVTSYAFPSANIDLSCLTLFASHLGGAAGKHLVKRFAFTEKDCADFNLVRNQKLHFRRLI